MRRFLKLSKPEAIIYGFSFSIPILIGVLVTLASI